MNDIRKIKRLALSKGVRMIDTAKSYFDGEKRLAKVGIDEFITLFLNYLLLNQIKTEKNGSLKVSRNHLKH